LLRAGKWPQFVVGMCWQNTKVHSVTAVSRALELALFMDAKLDVSNVPAK
jgi:hypothetical protein